MKVDGKISNFFKIIGFLYLLVHSLFFVAVAVLIFSARQSAPADSGYVLILFPGIGILAGYFIWKGTYNWWRNIIIIISLLILAVVLFVSLVATPAIEKAHKDAASLESKLVQLDKDIARMFEGIYADDIDIVREQLDKGVSANSREQTGATALHITQNKEIMALLISRGADVNALDGAGMTPLFYQGISLAKMLVAAGADVHAKTLKGNSILMWYCYSGYLEGVRYMHSLGVDVNIKNEDGQTAYDIAEHFHMPELLDYLKTIGAKPGKDI